MSGDEGLRGRAVQGVQQNGRELGQAALDITVDAAATAIPFVPAGTTKAVRIGNKAGDVASDINFVAKKTDTVTDGLKSAYNSSGHLTQEAIESSIPIASGVHDSLPYLRQANRLSKEYGGLPSDWFKMTTKQYENLNGAKYQSHYFQNGLTGKIVEPKTKLSLPKKK